MAKSQRNITINLRLLDTEWHATSTTVASSLSSSIYGQNVTWTAHVTSTDGAVPTGTVRFLSSEFGSTAGIGTATLNNGVATVTRAFVNAGIYAITAVYSGDTIHAPSTSPAITQQILQATSSAKLTSSPNPSLSGQQVTFTATITSPTVIAKGPVTFKTAQGVLGTAQLSQGKASLSTTSLPPGVTSVTVVYLGDSNISGSSARVSQTVH